jgi:hypothetical protein
MSVFETDLFGFVSVWLAHAEYFFEFASHAHIFRYQNPCQDPVRYAEQAPQYVPAHEHEQQEQRDESRESSSKQYPYQGFGREFGLEQGPK